LSTNANWVGAIAGVIAAVAGVTALFTGDNSQTSPDKNFPINDGTKTEPMDKTTDLPTSIPIQNIHKNVIKVKGTGILDMNIKNIAQRTYLGKQAARADAKRQIAEIFATTVEGRTSTQDGILSKEKTSTTVAEILRFTTVISEKNPGNGTIEVIMKAPLNNQ